MSSNTHWLRNRDQEIGRILEEARTRADRTVTECAAFLETSRRRYRAIERGEASIHAAELELLMRYLEVPPHIVWRELAPFEDQRVDVVIQPGEIVTLRLHTQLP